MKDSTLGYIFNKIYEGNEWGDSESKSGRGSNLAATATVRKELYHLLQKYDIKSILDIPCGDFNWMREMDLKGIEYTGADAVKALIESNTSFFPEFKFVVRDITKDPLPCVDLILCRDLFGHLSNENVNKALDNIHKSGSKYLLSTSLTSWDFCADLSGNGGWRCINLLIPPFKLRPIYLIHEDCQEGYPFYNDKCLILFDISKMWLEKLK